jgi:glutamate synthase (NADPH/NADH) small chain
MFRGENGEVKEALVEEVNWEKDGNGRFNMTSTGRKEVLKADLVLLALGFVHPVQEGLLNELGVNYDTRGNVAVDRQYLSSVAKVFAAGDAVTGASLVVKAIASGRKTAGNIHKMLLQQESAVLR